MNLDYDVLVRTQATPNPQALKFVVNGSLKAEGKATFPSSEEAQGVPLVQALFAVEGVEQLHLFENVVTVTHTTDTDRQQMIHGVTSVLQSHLPQHDPHFSLEKEAQQKRNPGPRSPEIDQIEEILDRTIRPGLQADGGDIEVVDLKDKVLQVSYQGACGSCPSAMYGTLDAIESILRHEFHPDLEIRIL